MWFGTVPCESRFSEEAATILDCVRLPSRNYSGTNDRSQHQVLLDRERGSFCCFLVLFLLDRLRSRPGNAKLLYVFMCIPGFDQF